MKSLYETSYKLACEAFAAKNLDDAAFNSSALLEGDAIHICLADESFIVGEHGKHITTRSGREPKISEKILLLHYLITSDGTPPSRQEVTLANIPGAAFYYPTYKQRSIDLILKAFGNDTNRLINGLKTTGWQIVEESLRHIKAKYLPLSNVPIWIMYWLPLSVPLDGTGLPQDSSDLSAVDSAQAEVNTEALQILYDANVTHYLPLEDIIILTELLAHKLIKTATEVSPPARGPVSYLA